jgi:WD40 repeat protein
LLRSWRPKQPRFGRWALSPDGRHLVVAHSGALRAFALEMPEEEVAVVKNKAWPGAPGIAFHPSGRWLALWHNGPTVKLFATDSWKPVSTYHWGIGRVQSVSFSADGSLGAVGGHKGEIVVWDFDV